MSFQVEFYRWETNTLLDSTWNSSWLVVGWFFPSLGLRHWRTNECKLSIRSGTFQQHSLVGPVPHWCEPTLQSSSATNLQHYRCKTDPQANWLLCRYHWYGIHWKYNTIGSTKTFVMWQTRTQEPLFRFASSCENWVWRHCNLATKSCWTLFN